MTILHFCHKAIQNLFNVTITNIRKNLCVVMLAIGQRVVCRRKDDYANCCDHKLHKHCLEV